MSLSVYCLCEFHVLGLIDKLLLEHVGLPNVLDFAVHLVNFFGWISQVYSLHFFTRALLYA